MGVIRKSSFLNTLISFFGAGLGFFTTIWLFPNILTPEQNGLTVVLLSIGIIYSYFAHLGTFNSINHFYFKVHDDKIRKGTLITYSLLLSCLGYLIVGGLVLIFKEQTIHFFGKRSPLLILFFNWIFPFSFLILFYTIFESYSRSLFKLVVPIFIREVLIRLLNIAAILAFAWHWVDFTGFIYLFAGSYLIALLLLLLFLQYRKQLPLNLNFNSLTKREYKEINKYNLFTILNGATWIFASRIDMLMLNHFLGLKAPAIYNVAMALVIIIQIPLRSMQLVAVPVITKNWTENNLEEIQKFYHKSAITLLLIGSFLFLMLFANLNSLFHFLPSVYREAKPLILILGISKVLDMATGVNTEIIQYSRKYSVLTMIIIVLMGITFTANFILIPHYGILGAAYASFIAYGVFNLMKYLYVKFAFKLEMTSQNYFAILAIGILTFLVLCFMPDYPRIILNSIIKSGIVLVLFLAPVYFLKLSPDLNSMIGHLKTRLVNLAKGKF